MFYWRSNAFHSLTEAADVASAIPAWKEYARFCELLGKGLRKDALAHLSAFTKQSANWSFSRKKEFISWLYNFVQQHTDAHLLMPHPLREEFVKPTLDAWIQREPENGEPHRWLGTPEHLKEAIRLNPADQIARSRLAEMMIYWAEYSVHELPYGYIGDPNADLQMLKEVESVIGDLVDAENRSAYQLRVKGVRETINAYLSGKTGT
jgi:hypothetical protein